MFGRSPVEPEDLAGTMLCNHAVPVCVAQQVVLLHREDGTLVTADEEPVVVARMSQEAAAAVGGTTPASGAPAAGKLLRLNIGPGGIQVYTSARDCLRCSAFATFQGCAW